MASKTKCINLALIAVSVRIVSSPTDTAKGAIVANEIFDDVRDMVLADHDWSFARAVSELAQNSTSPTIDYYYAYPLPSGCVKVRSMYPAGYDYNIVGAELHTDADECTIRYTQQMPNVLLWPIWFVEAFAAKLAMKIAAYLRGEDTAKDFEKEYQKILIDSRATDAGQNSVASRTERRSITYWHERATE